MGKSSRKYLIGGMVFLIVFAAVFLLLSRARIPTVREEQLPIAFAVEKGVIGMGETNARDIFFGSIPPGAKGKRQMNFTNFGSGTRTVSLVVEGDFAPWANFSENDFPLPPGGNRTITVSVAVPEDAVERNYTGVMRIRYTSRYSKGYYFPNEVKES